jgi:two-component system sensor histidine kinase ChiS
MESTVISDAVNTASRIEGLTKVFGVPVIISETVLAELDGRRDDINLRYLGRLPVRGRSQGLGMYELVHARDPLAEPKLRFRGRFEDCVRTWETDKAQADRLFADYRELFPTDPVLGFFMGASEC